ncbi:DNA helicase UvrD [Candidatus Peregrinibacteria bacterium]|nr:DNA helicase UvrD [Candidatus Peregrinibacteria bacterium]
MKFYADLHIHSHYSRATSKKMDLENLYKWAQIKGIKVIGTGDFTHPRWFAEILEKLEPAEEGLFKLKQEFAKKIDGEVPASCKAEVRFILSVEISSIYKKNDKTRKVHNIIFAPSLEVASKLNTRLGNIGNIKSDGRPILGLDSKKLLEICLEISDKCYLVPAHIWTPHFAVLGSNSGFDTFEECYEELTPKIFAAETGLSSDPPMNWRLSKLDNITLISNSDAHSPEKLAREANIFNCGLSYDSMFDALKKGDKDKFLGTLEFFPEEGKYHYDGHRPCSYCSDPKLTIENNYLCPRCGKKVTIGVMHRVETLADREKGGDHARAFPFKHLIPLKEIIADAFGTGTASKKVDREYFEIINLLGNELFILLEADADNIKKASNAKVAEAIVRVREGKVKLFPGYDGEYGRIQIFAKKDNIDVKSQLEMF